MRGAVRLNAPSYLPTLLGSGSHGISLLAALHGNGGPARDPDTVDPIEALQRATSGETGEVALVAAKPQVKRDIAQFTQALAAAETPAQLLANPAALKVLLTANGLGDQTGNPALATQALLSDPSQVGSPANTPADTRWLVVNQTYSFAEKGLSVLKDPGAVSLIAYGYAEELWRTNLDQTTPGLSNAIAFQHRASTITSVEQVLGDPTLRAVVTTALGVPEQTASQPQSAQEQAISARVDLTKFKDPSFVNQLTQRYLIATQQAANQTAVTAERVLSTTATHSAGLVV
jgi:Protein of unknown function (DUF1217)